MRLRTILMLATLTTVAAASSGAALVAERQQTMKDMAAAAKLIAGMFKGDVPYNQRAFKNAAETIAVHAGPALVAQFPLNTLGPPSQAAPIIATEPDEFIALATQLRRYADAISQAADTAPAGITPAMRMGTGMATGATSLLGRRAKPVESPETMPAEHAFHLMLQDCTACHARYRKAP